MKGLLSITLITLGSISFKLFNDNRVKQAKRAEFCRKAKPLNQVKAEKYDRNGIKERQETSNGGTFYKQVSFKTKPIVSVVIFPEALDPNTWAKLPQSAIKYIGKGGNGESLREWFSPDYFYLLEVPEGATGLAFGRLCYRKGDARVYSIKNWKQVGNNKISINGEINLQHPNPLPKINPAHIVVNVGTNQKDSLGDVTQVYFTQNRLRISWKKK